MILDEETYRLWLFAVDQALAELVDSGTSDIQDESFLQLWWKDLRESWAWLPRQRCPCGSVLEKGRSLCEPCFKQFLMKEAT